MRPRLRQGESTRRDCRLPAARCMRCAGHPEQSRYPFDSSVAQVQSALLEHSSAERIECTTPPVQELRLMPHLPSQPPATFPESIEAPPRPLPWTWRQRGRTSHPETAAYLRCAEVVAEYSCSASLRGAGESKKEPPAAIDPDRAGR